MSYRSRATFDQPSAETVQRTRRSMVFIIPLAILQEGWVIFGADVDSFSKVLGTVAWAAVTLTLLWWLFGLPLRWLSERDQAILNDEWHRSISGDAAKWGIAALAVAGCGMLIARFWVALDSGVAIYTLVNSATLVAIFRYAWLNRGEPDEDA